MRRRASDSRWLSPRWGRHVSVLATLLALFVLPDSRSARAQYIDPGSLNSAESAVKQPLPRGPKTLFQWTIGNESERAGEETESLVTDRPHFCEASSLVGFGRVQIESGYTYTQDGGVVSSLVGIPSDRDRVRTHSFPETLIRAGLFADWFEFRIAGNYLIENTTHSDASRTRVQGPDDLYLGAKFALTEQRGFLPEVALFPQALIPTGSREFTSGQFLPGFNLAYSWKFNDFLELECNTQLNRRRDDVGHSYTEFIQAANLEYQLTDRLGAFTEWFCFIPNGALSAGPQHYFHAGFVYLLTPNLQYDIHAATGLNRQADDFFAGTGLSIRF